MNRHLKPASFLFALGICAYASIPILWVTYLLITSNGYIATLPTLPTAGVVQSVPEDILSMKVLANRQKLNTYRVSKELDELGLYKMRSIEYLYPIKHNPKSSALFTKADTTIEPGCKLVEVQKRVALYDCQ